MSLLHLSQVSFKYPQQESFLLEGVTLDFGARERTAIVGINGSGKSTLVDLICGLLTPVVGEVIQRSDLKIGQMHQQLAVPPGATLLDVATMPEASGLHAAARMRAIEQQLARTPNLALAYADAVAEFSAFDGWNRMVTAQRILDELGVNDTDSAVAWRDASGGQRSLTQLARLLNAPADILVIDEPTNHLDSEALEWMSAHIATLEQSLIFVSHDRAFLESTATRVIDVRDGTAHDYRLSWSDYLQQRQLETTHAWAEYEAGERRRKATQRAIANRIRTANKVLLNPDGNSTQNDFYRSKASRIERTAKVIERRLEREPPAKRPCKPREVARIQPPDVPRGSDIAIQASDLGVSFGATIVLQGITLAIERGERVHVRGRNGCGKSTLLRALAGDLSLTTGTISLGKGCSFAYFAQDARNIDDEATPVAQATQLCTDRSRATTLLAGLRLSNRELHSPAKYLSPGKRSSTALALTLLSSANVVLLDEPTNHLDLETRIAVEAALQQFNGTLVFASHDRMFAKALATRIFDVGRT